MIKRVGVCFAIVSSNEFLLITSTINSRGKTSCEKSEFCVSITLNKKSNASVQILRAHCWHFYIR